MRLRKSQLTLFETSVVVIVFIFDVVLVVVVVIVFGVVVISNIAVLVSHFFSYIFSCKPNYS